MIFFRFCWIFFRYVAYDIRLGDQVHVIASVSFFFSTTEVVLTDEENLTSVLVEVMNLKQKKNKGDSVPCQRCPPKSKRQELPNWIYHSQKISDWCACRRMSGGCKLWLCSSLLRICPAKCWRRAARWRYRRRRPLFQRFGEQNEGRWAPAQRNVSWKKNGCDVNETLLSEWCAGMTWGAPCWERTSDQLIGGKEIR